MGCDVRIEHAGAVSGDARGTEAPAGAVWKGDQHGVARRAVAVGDPRALLFFEGSTAHVDESDGESVGSRDRGERCGSGHDRSGGEGGEGVHAEDGESDAYAAERD